MSKDLFHAFVERMAQLFRGPSYKIDSNIPTAAIIGVGFRRIIALSRCLFRGIVVSFNIHNLIFLEPNVKIRNRRMITFGKGITLGKGVIIDGLSSQGITIGDGVSIGPYSIIEATGVISNIGVGCTIGDNSGMGAYSFIGAAGGVWIGENVIMGQRMSFHSENHVFDDINVPIRLQGVTRQGIIVEDDCWIGANVTFLDGAYVGTGCVIAAGSVVRDHIQPYSIAAGVPARVIRSRVPDKK